MVFTDDTGNVTERDVMLAYRQAQSRAVQRPHPATDMHGLVQEFGGTGTPLEAGSMAIMVVTKRCRLTGWTLDTLGPAALTLSIQWATWAIPRTWANITGATGIAPALTNQANAEGDCEGWEPQVLERRDALLIAVDTTDTSIEQVTLVLYVSELPMNMLGVSLPPPPPTNGGTGP